MLWRISATLGISPYRPRNSLKLFIYTQTYTNLLLSLQLTTPKQFTKHGQKYKSFEDFLMMEVMSNLIYKRNKAIPKTACSSSFVCDSFGIESYSLTYFGVCWN